MLAIELQGLIDLGFDTQLTGLAAQLGCIQSQ